MDFIDPKKRRATKIRLFIGYFLITLAIIMTTLTLLYAAYGYSFGKNGQLIQKGLVFVSSSPSPASIYLNGVLNAQQTNARLNIPAGEYTIKLTRPGYRPWQRAVGVVGGSVERFDYPLLYPVHLVNTVEQKLTGLPQLFLESPSRQWILVQQPQNDTSFTRYDITNFKQLVTTTVTIPSNIVAPNVPGGSWQLVQWSTDNSHVLLNHIVNGVNDYILFDQTQPSQSIDLTKALSLNNTVIPSMVNNQYNQYDLYDPTTQTLTQASLSQPQPTALLSQVLAFKSFGSNMLLYATTQNAPTGKVLIELQQNGTTYTLQSLPAGASNYLLNLAQYNGNWFVAEGDSSGHKVYIYENPQNSNSSSPSQPLVPAAILNVNQPNFLSFSANTQFIMAENGNHFSVFDAQNDKVYAYQTNPAPVAGTHAAWMDGDRIIYASGGHVVVFDYDDANQQTLQPAVNSTPDFFNQAYTWSYTIAPNTGSDSTLYPYVLTQTSLLIPSDQ